MDRQPEPILPRLHTDEGGQSGSHELEPDPENSEVGLPKLPQDDSRPRLEPKEGGAGCRKWSGHHLSHWRLAWGLSSASTQPRLLFLCVVSGYGFLF